MGTYAQLIRALDMDHRAEEAHKFWVKNIGTDLHSVSWQLCRLMISIYYRNNRLEDLVKVCMLIYLNVFLVIIQFRELHTFSWQLANQLLDIYSLHSYSYFVCSQYAFEFYEKDF